MDRSRSRETDRSNSYSVFQIDNSNIQDQKYILSNNQNLYKQNSNVQSLQNKQKNQFSYGQQSVISVQLQSQHQQTIEILDSLTKRHQGSNGKVKVNTNQQTQHRYSQVIQKRRIEYNQRQKMLDLIKNKNFSGLYNKIMVDQLIPQLQQKFLISNLSFCQQSTNNDQEIMLQSKYHSQFTIRQQENYIKLLIIGIKVYKMTIYNVKQFRQIIQKYQLSQQDYFHADPRKKLLIFIYQIIYLIWRISITTSVQSQQLLQQAIKQVNQEQRQKFYLMGSKITQIYKYQKIKEDLSLIKKYFNCKKFSITYRMILFNQVQKIIRIIQGDNKTIQKKAIKITKRSCNSIERTKEESEVQIRKNIQKTQIKIQEIKQKQQKMANLPNKGYIHSYNQQYLSLKKETNILLLILFLSFILGLAALKTK